MARVLVVGSDIQGERALLQRLRVAASLPADTVRSCRDLDECDLLVIKDTPALRNAALRMVRERPRIQFWVEDQDGQLRPGQGANRGVLDDSAIECALRGMPAAVNSIDEPRSAQGAKAITRALRERLQSRQGHAALVLDDEPQLLLDFVQDQMVVPVGVPAASLAQDLSDVFDMLSLHGLSERRYQELAGALPRQPLRPLLWQWGQRPAHWQDLDARLKRGARVKLLRWPDFRVLGNQHDSFRLCSLLLKRACSVEECATLLDVRDDAVRDVVHPAYLCGYAAVEDFQSNAPAVRAPGGGGTLLSRMWRSVRQRGGG
ncbi:hypothetical protein [Stenotrophomonas sp.]|uniref:hypothetical protein n=1 Tax=Stenotrophomonas sp. TaxID=69392 RepID=UPI00289779D8|nr:hypothetical protein [Stenotrophomonas sp.]